jgi:gamma-glutamylcyclotransferase (GGCT)/AIG2-like uncharacterized protein YtfP
MHPGVARFDEDSTLFVYGSLRDPARRQEVLGRVVTTMPAILRDYSVGRARYHYIQRQPGAMTAGLLLVHLHSGDFAALDRYEETPVLYTREKITAIDASGIAQRCWVYLPTSHAIRGR